MISSIAISHSKIASIVALNTNNLIWYLSSVAHNEIALSLAIYR